MHLFFSVWMCVRKYIRDGRIQLAYGAVVYHEHICTKNTNNYNGTSTDGHMDMGEYTNTQMHIFSCCRLVHSVLHYHHHHCEFWGIAIHILNMPIIYRQTCTQQNVHTIVSHAECTIGLNIFPTVSLHILRDISDH